MATFTYRAYDNEGKKFSGTRRSESEAALRDSLEKKGLNGIDVYTTQTTYRSGLYKLVNPKELAIFCRQMSVMFFSHITLMEGIVLLSEQTENAQLKIALKEIYEHMDKGYTLSEAMGMYDHIFGKYLLNMVTIGETSGTLDTVFLRMSDYFDKESKLRKKLKSAITYPAILTVLMAGIILLLILKILPMFNDILEQMGAEMPAVTNVMLVTSLFISKYIWVIVIIIVALIIIINAYARTRNGRAFFDKLKFKLPVLKYINTRVITARFSRSLSILLKSGVQLVNALDDTKSLIDNKFLEPQFDGIVEKVKTGTDLSEAMKELNIFPPLFLKMLYIGQSTGHLDDMLSKSADIFDDEVDEAVEKLTVTIEPILIIILSVVVGIILVSVMLPMINIMNSIG